MNLLPVVSRFKLGFRKFCKSSSSSSSFSPLLLRRLPPPPHSFSSSSSSSVSDSFLLCISLQTWVINLSNPLFRALFLFSEKRIFLASRKWSVLLRHRVVVDHQSTRDFFRFICSPQKKENYKIKVKAK